MDSEVYGIKRSHIIIFVAVMVTVIIAEFHDNAHEDHRPDKIADILHSAVAEFGVDDLLLPLTDSDFEPFISFL